MSLTVELWRNARIDYSDQPEAPAAPVASNITQTGVTMTWTPVDGADWYRLEVSPAGAGTWVLNHHGGGLTKIVTGLTANTSYDFRLAAFAGGQFGAQSEWSPTTNITTLTSSSPPGTPSAPVASNISETTATLTVTAVATATFYGWQRSATSGTTGFATIAGTGLSINDSGLTASTPYWYKVRASNADGDSAYSTATAITTADPPVTVPGKPAKLILDSQTPTSNTLQLTPVLGADTYQVQRSSTAPGVAPWFNVTFQDPALLVTDTGRTPGATVYYRHSAWNAAGEGPQSDTLTVTNPTTNPNVQPVAASYIVGRSGVCTHPNFNGPLDVYKVENASEICQRVADMGFSFIRGLMPASPSVPDQWATQLRAHGLKWLMTVIPEGSTSPTTQTIAETTAKVQMIETRYPDICAAVEGLNEPNHNRGGGAVPGDWANTAFRHQQAIWAVARAGGSSIASVPIVGPSLHDVAADDSYEVGFSGSSGPRHYHQLLDEGILSVQTEAGLHTYPAGEQPITKLDTRLSRIYDAYGANYPVWPTEWGYRNSLGTGPGGHDPITEAMAAIYGPRAFLQFITTVRPNGVQRGPMRLTVYELMDDYDPNTPKLLVEANSGMVGVTNSSETASVNPANWRSKPIVGTVGNLLNALADPAGTPAYTPGLVVCDVTSPSAGANLQWQVTATKAQADAGIGTVWVYRDMKVWNQTTQTPITVPTVATDIRDRVGTRRFNVDANVFRVDLR